MFILEVYNLLCIKNSFIWVVWLLSSKLPLSAESPLSEFYCWSGAISERSITTCLQCRENLRAAHRFCCYEPGASQAAELEVKERGFVQLCCCFPSAVCQGESGAALQGCTGEAEGQPLMCYPCRGAASLWRACWSKCWLNSGQKSNCQMGGFRWWWGVSAPSCLSPTSLGTESQNGVG